MDKPKQTVANIDTKTDNHSSRLIAIFLGVAVICIIGLIIALWWCLWSHKPGTATTPPTPPAGETTTTAVGPCYDGAANELPAGYSWYENADLGYKFAYPSAWGVVTVATDPMGGTSGHYVLGSFAGNPNVSFGGNGTDYIVNPRGGAHTDNPGYVEATSKFYSVQFWRLNEFSGTPEYKYALYPIDGTTVRKDGCNTHAAVTQYPYDDFYGESYDIARVNLQPSNLYYGVNFVLKNPTAEARADLDKIIRSFQLIL
ncbi:MAG TPA: hypothetical protein VM581_00615 [Magnetospirillaceae bacterium]|nr:hypothetical protein [Magnetospirillaceae bacterium]